MDLEQLLEAIQAAQGHPINSARERRLAELRAQRERLQREMQEARQQLVELIGEWR